MRVWEAKGLEQGWDEWTGRGPPSASLYDQGKGGVFSQKGGREEEEKEKGERGGGERNRK